MGKGEVDTGCNAIANIFGKKKGLKIPWGKGAMSPN